jgi:hypothetical protein
MKNKCSNDSQNINKGMWYYEQPGSIELVISRQWFEDNTSHQGVIVRVSRRKLENSLKRMNASKRKVRR